MRKADPALHRRRSEEIAAAAARCFLGRGFHQTSMQDIAAAAGVSMGLLYRYFASKDAIIEAVAAIDREQTVANFAAIAQAPDAPQALEALAREQIRAGGKTAYVALVAEIAAEACRNPAIRALVERDELALRQALVAALRVQQQAKRIAAGADLEAVAQIYLAAIDGLAMRLHFDPTLDVDACLAAFRPVLAALRC